MPRKRSDKRTSINVRVSKQLKRSLELEAARLHTDVHSLLHAELFPMFRRVRKRHADQVSHLPH